jgi:signal transduction histidine kinase
MGIVLRYTKNSSLALIQFLSGFIVIMLGLFALIGWRFNIRMFSSIRTDFIPMAPTTACVFILFGLFFVFRMYLVKERNRKKLIFFISVLSIYCGLQFVEYLFRRDFTLDSFLFPTSEWLGKFPVYQMSPYTGLLFFLSGVALLLKLKNYRRATALNIVSAIGLIVLVVAFVACLGYLFGTPFLYSGNIIPLAAPTALAFFSLGSAIITLVGSKIFPVYYFAGQTANAKILKAILPIVIFGLLIEGFLNVVFVRSSEINSALSVALLTLFMVVITVIIVVRVSQNVFKHANEAEVERKQADLQLLDYSEKLKISNDTKDRLFSIIAHDLKSPFNAILGFSQILINEYDNYSNEEQKLFIKKIKDSSESAFLLLENLLYWSRTQTEGLTANPVSLNLFEIVSNQIDILNHIADSKGITIRNFVSQSASAFADIDMIKTVLLNLLNNAIKFTFQEGVITIAAHDLENQVEVSVADTGLGISRDNLKNLFKIDVSQSTRGTSGEKGTGLGLIICKEFVEINGGNIRVESELGKGSSFCFTLPKTAPIHKN